MLTKELTELLKHELREVLNTPSLLMQLLRLYSNIYLNDAPCSTCEKKHEAYFRRLQKDGITQIKKNKIMAEKKSKYILKDGVVMHSPDGVFSKHNLTDAIAERLVKQFPRLKGNFVNAPGDDVTPEDITPEKVIPEEVKPEAVKLPTVKPKQKRNRTKKVK